MKIIAIGRNYAEHAKELNNPVPTVPVIFMKPDTALLKDNKPFYHPDFSEDIHHEIEVVLKVCKEGKHIAEKFCSRLLRRVSPWHRFYRTRHPAKAQGKGPALGIGQGF